MESLELYTGAPPVHWEYTTSFIFLLKLIDLLKY